MFPLAAAANWSEAISPEYLFGDLPSLCAKARLPFAMAAFLILCFYLKSQFGKAGTSTSEMLKGIMIALITAVFIANIPLLMTKTNDVSVAIAQEAGGGKPDQIVENMWLVSDGFMESGASQREDLQATDPLRYGSEDQYVNAMYDYYRRTYGGLKPGDTLVSLRAQWVAQWNAARGKTAGSGGGGGGDSKPEWYDISGQLSGLTDKVYGAIMTIVKLVVSGLCKIVLWIGGLVIYVFDCVRYLLLQLGSVMLPVFIAGLLIPFLRNQSSTYIGGLVGIFAWPIGWALGNLGTAALFSFVMNWTGNMLQIPSLTANSVISDPSSAQAAAQAINAAIWINPTARMATLIGALLVVLVGLLVILAWIVLVMFGYPKLISKVLAQGALMFDSLTKGAGNTALNTVGAGSKTAGMLSVMGGGGFKFGGSGAGAGGGDSANNNNTGGPDMNQAGPKVGMGGTGAGSAGALGGAGGEGESEASAMAGMATTGSGAPVSDLSGSAEDIARSTVQSSQGRGGGGGSKGGGKGGKGLTFSPAMALGKTLQNLANWSGDPESFHQVPDTAIDEARQFSAENAMASMPEKAENAAADRSRSAEEIARSEAKRQRRA